MSPGPRHIIGVMTRWGAALAAVLLAFLSFLALTSAVARAQGPFLGVFPNPTTDRQVTAFGSEFCSAPSCSTVTITIDERLAVSGVQVGPDGKFQVTFTIIDPAGNYTVTASQTNSEGSVIFAQAQLTVLGIDFIEPTAVPPAPSPSAQGTPPGQEPTPTPAGFSPTPTELPPSSPTPPRHTGGVTPAPTTVGGRGEGTEDDWISPLLLTAIAGGGVVGLLALAIALRRASRR